MYHWAYHFKSALHNIRINGLSAFFTVLTTTLTLMLLGIFLLFYDNSRDFLASIQDDVQVSVYLREGAQRDAVKWIEKTLKGDPRIASFHYISQDEALALFQEKFSGESLVAHLGGNPLPASFEVNIAPAYQNPKDMAHITTQIRKWPGVEEVQYGVEWLKNFSDILMVLKFLGIGLFAGLAIAVVTIIAHAIRLHFYDRSEEVEIMRLIGATPRFIKNPFLLEGVFIGAVGGVFACTAMWGLFRFVHRHLADIGGIVGQLLRPHFLPPHVLAGLIVMGAILGGLGGELSLIYLLRFRAKAIPKSRLRAGLFCLGMMISLGVTENRPVWGKDDAIAIDARKKELRRVEKEIKEKKTQAQNLQKEEQSILSTLETIDRHIRTSQKEAKNLRDKIKRKEGEREYVSETLHDLEQSIKKRREQVAKRVRLLYREGTEGVVTVLIPSPDYPLFLKRLHYLKAITEKEAEMLSMLKEEQEQWEEKNSQIGNMTRQLVATQEPLVARLDKIESEREKKRAVLDRIRDEKAYYEQMIPELDKASSELKGLIKKLEEERRRREAMEAMKKVPQAAPPPVGSFGTVKGRLSWPNGGTVTSLFGRQKHARFNTYVFKKGIEIEISQEDTVRAVHEGTVVYADWFKGYGMIIILDHGEDYYSVYGYLAKLFVKVGEKAERNRVLGAVGNTGLSDGKHLYFELRHQGDPMDPLAWLQKR